MFEILPLLFLFLPRPLHENSFQSRPICKLRLTVLVKPTSSRQVKD